MSSPAKPFPVFVTKYSLAPKTAIGIQTKHYLDAFPDWRHLFWREYGVPVGGDRRSIRFGNVLVGRWPDVAKRVRKLPAMGWVGRPAWVNDILVDRASCAWVEAHKDQVSALYLAPIDHEDAKRMRYLAEVFGRPFVLHLWDSLNGPLLASKDFRWLIERAHQVLGLSEPLIAESRELRPDAAELLFVREETTSRAEEPGGGPLRVALIGYLQSYRTGLHLLVEAFRAMRAAGIAVELQFVGSPRVLERLGEPEVTKDIRPTGHQRSNAARDAALARCHVAFLPGPLESPEDDMRSRYSIPSRVLDFMAVGLPVVGTVHPQSATARFYAEYGVGEHLLCGSAADIAGALTELRIPEKWEQAHRASLQALDKIDCPGQLNSLKGAMAAAAASA